MSWWDHDDRVERAKKLWIEGCSANEIFRTIGAPSRNAVISKLNRIGLTGRDKRVRLPAASPTRPPCAAAPPKPSSPIAPPRTGALTVASAVAGGVAVVQRAHVPADRGPRDVQPLPALRHVPGQGEGALLVQLNDHRCRWPIAGAGTDRPLADHEEMRFCGCRPEPGRIYCAPHAAIAYQSVSTSAGRTPRAELERSLRRYL